MELVYVVNFYSSVTIDENQFSFVHNISNTTKFKKQSNKYFHNKKPKGLLLV